MPTGRSGLRQREAGLGRAAVLRTLAISAALLVAVVALRALLAVHTFPWDLWAARLGMSHKSWVVWDITRVYQQVGRPLVAIGLVMVMAVWLWRAAGRRAAQGLLIVLGASAVNGLIKIVCGPTPLWLTLPRHVGTNFPSGVVTFMTASVGYVALVRWRQGHRVLPVALAGAIAGAGPARVIGGQHLASDVVASYAIGVAWLLIAARFLLAAEAVGRWERVVERYNRLAWPAMRAAPEPERRPRRSPRAAPPVSAGGTRVNELVWSEASADKL